MTSITTFTTCVNIHIAAALAAGIPPLEIIAALEGMAGAIEDKIEAVVSETTSKEKPDGL